jgi:hypothetical protein
MFRGFNLNIDNTDIVDRHEIGQQLYNQFEMAARRPLNLFLENDGSIDVESMKNDWFPEIDANVFISHSHKNRDTAIALSGWLYTSFKLRSFVDSCIWGYANDLLKLVDDEYCYNTETQTYSYARRNNSTSHIHMVLSTALNMMINRAECIIFLNTPEAICANDAIRKSRTYSPWIYSEIAITQLIEKRSKEEHRGIIKTATEVIAESKQLRFSYPVNLSHLVDINVGTLEKWKSKCQIKTYRYPLDALYELTVANT